MHDLSKKELHIRFQEAVDYINSYNNMIPADILLNLYAFYRIANGNLQHAGGSKPLINGFKANALFQLQHLSPSQAKIAYISLCEKEFDFKSRS